MKTAQVVQIVVNPHAGRARGLQILEPLTAALRTRGYRPEVLIMDGPQNALRWSKQCPPRADYLVSLGGDDTLDDLAYAALRHQIPLIAVPVGFGNACARHFGHHATVSTILDLLESGECIQVDAALQEIGGEDSPSVFLSAAIYGFLNIVKHAGEQTYFLRRRRYLRKLHYMLSASKSLSPNFPVPTLAIEVDGELLTDEAAVAIVSNVPAFPGHLLFTPDADPLDGLLDVCVILAESGLGLLSHLFKLWLGSASVERHLIRRQGRKIRITGTRGLGHPGGLPFAASRPTKRITETLTIQPRAVPVLVAPALVPQETRDQACTTVVPDRPRQRALGIAGKVEY